MFSHFASSFFGLLSAPKLGRSHGSRRGDETFHHGRPRRDSQGGGTGRTAKAKAKAKKEERKVNSKRIGIETVWKIGIQHKFHKHRAYVEEVGHSRDDVAEAFQQFRRGVTRTLPASLFNSGQGQNGPR